MGPSPFKKGGLARVAREVGWPKAAPGIHVYTPEEYKSEAASPYYNELDSAGEPRIVPRTTHVRLDLGTILHVLRTRVRPPDLYNRHARGWVLTLNTATGQEVYVQEKYLEPVE